MWHLDKVFNDLTIVAIPTRTNFRGVTVREAALFRGPAGWSEFSPFIEYSDNESEAWLQAALEGAYIPWPQLARDVIDINATLPKVEIDRVPEILNRFPGAKTVKIKIDDFENDSELVEAALDFNPEFKVRLDVNGGWSVEQALANLYAIYEEVGPLEYVEQPCATLEELRQLKEKLAFEIKIAGDEVIRKAEDPFAINLQGAVDILMLKASPLGGITRAREIGAHHKLPMVVSSALDSAVGISYGLQLAASLPSLDYACGLATGQLLSADIAALPLKNGELAVHSVSPDADLLAKYAVPVERLTWWKERTKRAFYAGAESEIKARGWNW